MNADYTFYLILAGGLTMLGSYVANRLKSKFQHYRQIPTSSGLSGAEVAASMLRDYGVQDVRIVAGQGFLSDHYNPQTKTVTLSPDVFEGRNISAAAVAAHECGHAVQHATGYPFLHARSALVPFVKAASRIQGFLLIVALMMASTMPALLFFVIIAFAVTTLFSLITLPVEFDASNRALTWLQDSGIASPQEHAAAKDALWWAAMTYVAGALSSFVILVYLLFNFMGRRS